MVPMAHLRGPTWSVRVDGTTEPAGPSCFLLAGMLRFALVGRDSGRKKRSPAALSAGTKPA